MILEHNNGSLAKGKLNKGYVEPLVYDMQLPGDIYTVVDTNLSCTAEIIAIISYSSRNPVHLSSHSLNCSHWDSARNCIASSIDHFTNSVLSPPQKLPPVGLKSHFNLNMAGMNCT